MTIQQYIDDGGSFRQGVELLRQVDSRAAAPFARLLGRPFVDPVQKGKLIAALRAYADVVVRESEQQLGNTSPHPRRKVAQPAEPDVITEYRQRGRMLKKQESFLHAQLVTAAQEEDSDERGQRLYDLADQIMQVEAQLDEVYDDIREYERTGALPVAGKAAVIAETVAKMQRRDSLRSMVYRLRKKVEAEKDPAEKDILQRDLQAKEQEIEQINQELGL